MTHHIVYWKLGRREADVGDAALRRLEAEEDRGELYIEFRDGLRLPLMWDHATGHWLTTRDLRHAAAA